MKHHIPYKRNLLFTGREGLLAKLSTFFASALPSPLKIATLVGMPGVGKTEIALEYVYRTQRSHQIIIWLDASARWQLAQNIAQILNAFGMRLSWNQDNDTEQIFGTFRMWLRQYQFLLVLDDIHSNYNLLFEILDDDMAGHVLVTDSSLLRTDEINSVVVPPFDEQEGTLFLLRRAGLLAQGEPLSHASREARQAASVIHEEFGGHPLALDQAGAYVSETGVKLTTYLQLYRKDRRAFLDRRGTASASHPFSVYTVIGAMRQGTAYFSQELLFLYAQNLLDCSDPYPQLPPTLRASDLLRKPASELFEMRASLIQNFLLVPYGHKKWDMHPLVRTVMLEVLAYQEEQDRLSNEQDERYEPLDEDAVFQILVEVQQMKTRVAALPPDDPETAKPARTITTTVLRLTRAVLPGPQEQRWEAKDRIEELYSTLVHGSNALLVTTSREDLRGYAREFLALMQYR